MLFPVKAAESSLYILLVFYRYSLNLLLSSILNLYLAVEMAQDMTLWRSWKVEGVV